MPRRMDKAHNIKTVSHESKIRNDALNDLLNAFIVSLNENDYLIAGDIFTDTMSKFKELVTLDKFGKTKELGKLNKFIHDFQVSLKKKLYEEKLSDDYLIESSLNNFFKELQRNTDAFMKKHQEMFKQRNKIFKNIQKSIRFKKDGTINVDAIAKRFSYYLSKTRNENLRYVIYSENIIDELINYLEKEGRLYLENPLKSKAKYEVKSEVSKQKIKEQLKEALEERVTEDKDKLTARIHKFQRIQIRKISYFQDKMNYRLDLFSEKFVTACKRKKISDQSTVIGLLVRKLQDKKLFNYHDIEKVASIALKKLSRDNFFAGMRDIDKDAFVKELKYRAISNNLIDLDKYGVPARRRLRPSALLSRPRLKKNKIFHNFEELEQYLIKRTENQEFTNKAAMSPYVSELLNLLIDRRQLRLPSFSNEAEKRAYINEQRDKLVNSVCKKIDSFRKEIVEGAIEHILERKEFISSPEKLKLLLNKLKEQHILKGKLHYPAISNIIIDKIWAQTAERSPTEFQRTKKFYKQALIDLYSEDISTAQKKIERYNKVGLLASTGSFSLGLWAIAVLAGIATAPVLGPVSAIAPGAIITSLTGLINSSYASKYTVKKEFAQNMVNEILSEGEKEDYRELFDNIPTIGKIATRLSLNPQMKKRSNSEYGLFAEFMEQLENLEYYQAQDLLRELNINKIDLNTQDGCKKFLIRFLQKAQSTIEARINISEVNSIKYANNSYYASLGTFGAGALVTAASVTTNPASAFGQALGYIASGITGTGMISIGNASLLDQTKRNSTRPLNKLYTNLSLIIDHIHSGKAHIKIPKDIFKAFEEITGSYNIENTVADNGKETTSNIQPKKKFTDKFFPGDRKETFVEALETVDGLQLAR